MAREAFLKQGSPCETVIYNNSDADSAGEVIFVAGIGVMIASTDVAASTDGVYYIKGIFQFPQATAVAVAQGDKCYWDVSANKLILSSSTSLALGDPYLGRAVADDSATAGYVDVEINNNRIDFSAGGTLAPTSVIIASGLQTCVNVTLVTNATLETILVTHALTTDQAFVNLGEAGSGDTSCHVIYAKTYAGGIQVALSTPASASAPTTKRSYQVVRAI